MVTLDQVEVGGRARVRSVHGEPKLVQRLLEMGLTEDEELQVAARAPLGDPIEIWLRNYRLSLRASEAKFVRCDLIAGES